jgi:anti-sigma regulatory factor (Ser/Thr protein kinase)
MSITTSMQHDAARAETGPGPAADRVAGTDLPAVPESARTARRFARAALAQWGLPALVDDVDLVVSELITNALLHARSNRQGGIRLELLRRTDALVCRISDGSALPPAPEQVAETAESGRGLLLVQAVSASWGWSYEPHGKVVWAEFDLDQA